ncbi:hypothetical protein [Bacillus sonorensis]|uniref:hypothetical protein n=1 Tax=Bacillus sonorensis TaxID=119858 RepID=UPI000E4FF4A1|nr:hypothetical protein [Bacillus sonorensis]MCY8034121.1 hypothetical protein [Bacillus sonorensis]RHJ10045.1 hypothetical protein DW143_12370 [Bacillus sonorensis]
MKEIWYNKTDKGEFCVFNQWFKDYGEHYYFYAFRDSKKSEEWLKYGVFRSYKTARKYLKKREGDPGRMKRVDQLPDGLTPIQGRWRYDVD